MTLVVDLPPETEAQTRKVAEAEGVDVSTVLEEALRAYLPTAGSPQRMTEADLLRNINLGFPEQFWRRYRELVAERRAGTLTPEQQAELITFSDRAEQRAAERLVYLTELAARRGTSVRSLMNELGIRPVRVE
ncbi:MAG: hypothetical protein JO250_22585 [Armatimonadetes bacterium]|nr:hypothetical protein [Armatimonadota bacterium]